MATCPSCGAAHEDDDLECPACHAALNPEDNPVDPAARPDAGAGLWQPIFTGHGAQLGLLTGELTSMGITVVRNPYPRAGATFEVGIFGTDEASNYTLSVPQEEYAARYEEIEAAVASLTQPPSGDPQAIAEAEEDFDVRACPVCRRFFHECYSVCPAHSAELLPAVECFREGQLEADRVIVAHGTDAAHVAERLGAAGFEARSETLPQSSVTVVDVPWRALTDRTSEVERALAGPRPSTDSVH